LQFYFTVIAVVQKPTIKTAYNKTKVCFIAVLFYCYCSCGEACNKKSLQ